MAGQALAPFPDAETVVMDLLAQVAPTVTATPADLTPPVIRVNRVGGSDDGITDTPRMEIACYGVDRPQAWYLSEQCRQIILSAYGVMVGDVLIDSTRTDNPPTQVPYAATEDTRRVVSYYRLGWRRPRSA